MLCAPNNLYHSKKALFLCFVRFLVQEIVKEIGINSEKCTEYGK